MINDIIEVERISKEIKMEGIQDESGFGGMIIVAIIFIVAFAFFWFGTVELNDLKKTINDAAGTKIEIKESKDFKKLF